jgi:hypothetical protein
VWSIGADNAIAAYNHFAYKYSPLPVVDDCTGSEGAALDRLGSERAHPVSVAMIRLTLSSFYRATYKKTGNKAKAASVGTGLNGHAQAAKRGSEKSKVGQVLKIRWDLVLTRISRWW